MKKIVVMIAVVILMTACTDQVKKEIVEITRVKTLQLGNSEDATKQMYSGIIEAGKKAELSFTVGGTLTAIPIEEGMAVSKGQLIAEINKTLAMDNYKTARVQQAKARDAYKRYKNMYDTQSMPEAQWVEVQNNLQQADIQVNMARKQLTDCRVRAPFSGYVSSREAQAGQNVSAGMTVATITNISKVKVSIHVPSTEIGDFNKGHRIQVIVPELENSVYTATIIEKGIEADNYTRTYTIKALMNNPNGKFLPGMLCKLTGHPSATKAETIVIPENIIQINSDNSHFVWVSQAGKATRRTVITGELTSNGVVVTSGLHAGERIIVEGQQKVYEGCKVKDVNNE